MAAELAVGDEVVFLAEGFSVMLRGRVRALEADEKVLVELVEAALGEDGLLREPGPASVFRVPRSVVVRTA